MFAKKQFSKNVKIVPDRKEKIIATNYLQNLLAMH